MDREIIELGSDDDTQPLPPIKEEPEEEKHVPVKPKQEPGVTIESPDKVPAASSRFIFERIDGSKFVVVSNEPKNEIKPSGGEDGEAGEASGSDKVKCVLRKVRQHPPDPTADEILAKLEIRLTKLREELTKLYELSSTYQSTRQEEELAKTRFTRLEEWRRQQQQDDEEEKDDLNLIEKSNPAKRRRMDD